MGSFYSVIRYVPDPIADESINVGVVAFSNSKIKFQFINNWNRARLFGKESVKFLRDFVTEVTSDQLNLFSEIKSFDESTLRRVLGYWKNSIQFSEIRASIKPLDQLVREISGIYLRDIKERKEPRVPGKGQVLRVTWNKLNAELFKRYGRDGESLLKRAYQLQGRYEKHQFDLAVANSSPYLGAFTLSFMVRDSNMLQKEVDAAAFAVEDVKRANKALRLALVALPPKGESESFNRALHIFNALKTPVIRHHQIDHWIKDTIKRLPSDLLERVT